MDSRNKIVLDFIKKTGTCSSKEVHDNVGIAVSYATLKRILSKLKNENYLLAVGQGKGTKYTISPTYELVEPIDVDEERNIPTEMHNAEMQELLKYFMNAYVEYCYNNINRIFTNQSDIHVADSILHLFENRENIEQYNKKALYVFIRERTGLQTNNITKVIKVLKQIYTTKFKEYEQNEFVNLPF